MGAREALAAGFIATLLAACGFSMGDTGIQVTIENRLDRAVIVAKGEQDPMRGTRVPPLGTARAEWLSPGSLDDERRAPPFRVEARSETGELIFCAMLTYEGIRRDANKLDITIRNDCN